MTSRYFAIVRRDVRLMAARGSEALATLFFFATVACLFAITMSTHEALMAVAAPGILWISALLAGLLALDAVYARDFEDGTFDLLLMSPLMPAGIMGAKMLSHWLLSGLGLVIASLVVAPMIKVPGEHLGVMCFSLLLGTLYISLLGGVGAALTLGARRSGLLLAVLILPLLLPMLILGILTAEAALAGFPYTSYLLLQLAMVIAATGIAPAASAAFLNMHLRSS
ncbi:MAG: heme exporter protein CcmB [Alphaproteobacteria bacterium]